MRATTTLAVSREMRVTVQLEMSVDEMDAILRATAEIRDWPMTSLKQVLSESLHKARDAYSSPHVING